MFKEGKWDNGELVEDENITMNECACVLQYAQTCFEGMKAYETVDGHVVVFRPDLNAKRMHDTALRLEMEPYPEDKFIDAVVETVKANLKYVPPYGTGASLYIRPYLFGYSPVMGVKPAQDFMFRVFVSPVGPYFKGGSKPITLKVSDFDRAAPHGTGHVKAGLNYAMSLHAGVTAHKEGMPKTYILILRQEQKLKKQAERISCL
jgi:branched-chain amino acid aminotransferase